MKKRIQRLVTATVILAVAGLLYYALNRCTGFALHCPIHYVSGLNCPGCGVTRMLFSILELDFKAAFSYNAAIFLSLPLLFLIASTMVYDYIKYEKTSNRKWREIMVYFLIAFFLIFGILRNIPYFSFLSPNV